MSKQKIARRRRPTIAEVPWTDAEVLLLVDAVLLARDTELAHRMLMVLSSRDWLDRPTTLTQLQGVHRFAAPRIRDVDQAPEQLGRLLTTLARDPACRPELKRLAATIATELGRGRRGLLELFAEQWKLAGSEPPVLTEQPRGRRPVKRKAA
jgi:hypothetical protein